MKPCHRTYFSFSLHLTEKMAPIFNPINFRRMELLDAHTFSLDSQGNVYTVTSITPNQSHTTKLIVATLHRKVFCMELSMSHCARPCGCVVVPQSQEIQFTYIPSGAEIISIDAFNRSKTEDDFVIGVTILKSAESGSRGQYLNIYSDLDVMLDHKPWKMENLAQNCISLLLDFVPYQLTHCTVDESTLWVLGGSDNRIHIYSEDKEKHMYLEVESCSTLPEFSKPFKSVPIFTDIMTVDNVRLTVTCCECGQLVVTRINTDNTNLEIWEKQFDGPLTSARLFYSDPTPITPPSFLNISQAKQPSKLNLCVSYSLGETQVYHNILDNMLNDSMSLPYSSSYDIVTCICVADISMSGRNSVILGCYGQMVLCYSFINDLWQCDWRRSMSAPVLSIRCEDVTGDGVRELVVVTSKGVQVLQPQLDNVMKLTLERLKKLATKQEAVKTET